MNKKLIAGIVIAAAVVCCGGGYVAMQNEKKVKQENVQISEMLDKLPDITVKEGESLPDLKNNIEDTSMIEPDTLKVDIQNVDITVPGTYDVVYSFKDIHGNERSKTVQCKVEIIMSAGSMVMASRDSESGSRWVVRGVILVLSFQLCTEPWSPTDE